MLQGQKLHQAYYEFIVTYSKRKGLDPKTVENKKHALDGLIPFLNERPFDVDTAYEYADLMKEKGWITPYSQLNIIKNLRAFINFLFDYDYIEKNFSKKLLRPKVIHHPEPLPDIDQAEAVIIAATTPGFYDTAYHRKRKALVRFALQFALRTGVRSNELRSIRGKDLFISDTDPDSSKVYLIAAKGGIPEWQPLPLDMLPELKKHVNDGLVFPVNRERCNLLLKEGARKIGLPKEIHMHLHILRKVFGTTLSRYLTLTKVSRLMRHTDIHVTQEFYINYGLSELGSDLNMNHPLIRLAVPPEEDIRAFLQNVLYPHFKRSQEIKIKDSHDPKKRTFIFEISY